MNFVASLKKIASLSEMTIGTSAGKPVFHEGVTSPDDVVATASVCLQSISMAGEAVGLGTVSSVVIQGEKTVIIVPKDNKIANITLADRGDGQAVISFLEKEKWEFSKPAPPSNLNPSFSKPISGKSATGQRQSLANKTGDTTEQTGKLSQELGEKSLLAKSTTIQTGSAPLSSAGAPPMATTRSATTKPTSLPPIRRSANKPLAKKASTSDLKVPEDNAAPQQKKQTPAELSPSSPTLDTLRLALYSGDLSDLNGLKIKIPEQSIFTDKQIEQQFISDIDKLSDIVRNLLQNRLDAEDSIKSFLSGDPERNITIRWAALIWQVRLLLARGKIEEAEESARLAYQLSHEFDIASRGATICLIAEVYMMAGKLESALKVTKTAKAIVDKAQTDQLKVTLALIEAQIFAMEKKYTESSDAATVALNIFPHISYPKIVLARLKVLGEDYAAAKALYKEILDANAMQPDALMDSQIIAQIESESIPGEVVATYFNMRELAPTKNRIAALRDALSKAPTFAPLRNLLVWRLIGLGEKNKSLLLHHPEPDSRASNRFKPNVIIGYSASAIITSKYIELDSYISETYGAQGEPVSNNNVRLSMLSEDILSIVKKQDATSLFSGELNAFSMPDLLEFLRNGNRTGSLICTSSEGVGAIEMNTGHISCAIVPDVDNIGTLLMSQGKITRESLEQAIEAQDKDLSGARIGAILAEKGLVDVEDIRKVLKEQTFSAIRTMLGWTDGRFVFTPSSPDEPTVRSLDMKMDARFVLMELFRELDESRK